MAGPVTEAHVFRRAIAVNKIGDHGLAQTITAKPPELLEIAAYMEVAELKTLTAEVALTRWHGKGVKLTGTLKADVVQNCVVTLDPVEGHIEASFQRHFLPPEKLPAKADADEDIFVDPTAEDPPEPLGHDIDLGEVLLEELALNLDPYPRKPGTAFQSDVPEARENPFAVLAKLKPKK